MLKSVFTVRDLPKNYLKIEIFLLKICGISLTGNESIAYKLYSFLVLYFFVFSYPLIACSDLFKHEIAEFTKTIVYLLGACMLVFVIAVAYFNRIKLGLLLKKLEKEPFLPNMQRGGEREEELRNWWISLKKRQGLVFYLAVALIYSYTVIITFIKRLRSKDYHDWAFGFGSITILNVTYSPNYEILWMYQNIAVFYITFNGCSIILILAASLAFIAMQFKILQNNLRRLIWNSYQAWIKDTKVSPLREIDVSAIPWKYLKIALKKAILYHLKIIDLAADLEEIFNNTMLSIYLCSVVILCFEVYRMSLLAVNDAYMVMLLFETIDASFPPLLICYGGQKMTNESFNVAKAAYEANSVGVDLRFQKGLIMIINRSQKPLVIKAGKFIETSMETYLWIVRTGYSTCMVLRSVRGE